MSKEIEVKILGIDPKKIRGRLAALGAKPVRPMYKQKRYVFDITPGDKSKWIRLRSNGEFNTLAVKVILNDKVDGTLEYETVVSDIRATLEILRTLGYRPKSYQENYREDFTLGGVSISIDQWPKLKPYVEIEAKSKAAVSKALKALNPEANATTSRNTSKLYLEAGIDLDKRKNLIFSQAEERQIDRAETG